MVSIDGSFVNLIGRVSWGWFLIEVDDIFVDQAWVTNYVDYGQDTWIEDYHVVSPNISNHIIDSWIRIG